MWAHSLTHPPRLARHGPPPLQVWNLSDESYDGGVFEHNVLEFGFPGLPAPPLVMLFRICLSIENWVLADPANVAAIHCMVGATGALVE